MEESRVRRVRCRGRSRSSRPYAYHHRRPVYGPCPGRGRQGDANRLARPGLCGAESDMTARSIRVRGVVQGVGFRPFVFRLARANGLAGWVLNEPEGVDIHLEGPEYALEAFVHDLEA